jgi:hypothetical protein
MDLKSILDAGIAIATITGGAVTIYTYWRNSGLKRAEWLYQLYEKFYEESYYKKIRQIIDYEREEEIGKLKNGIENDCEDELIESLVNYLNFFEFIASLWKLGQLPIKEIAMIFEYYILRIGDYEFLNKFLVDESFDHLPELIDALKKRKGI